VIEKILPAEVSAAEGQRGQRKGHAPRVDGEGTSRLFHSDNNANIDLPAEPER
jgi:hypothetical protein